jgi:hypothetical protein
MKNLKIVFCINGEPFYITHNSGKPELRNKYNIKKWVKTINKTKKKGGVVIVTLVIYNQIAQEWCKNFFIPEPIEYEIEFHFNCDKAKYIAEINTLFYFCDSFVGYSSDDFLKNTEVIYVKNE